MCAHTPFRAMTTRSPMPIESLAMARFDSYEGTGSAVEFTSTVEHADGDEASWTLALFGRRPILPPVAHLRIAVCHLGDTLVAHGPFGPWPTSYSTCWPSWREA